MFFMGIWMAGMILVAIVATQNLYSVDRLIANSTNTIFGQAVNTEQSPTVRDLLWYFASEINRLYFQLWNIVQLPIGILTLWIVSRIPNSKHAVWGITAMLLTVMFLTLFITPPIVNIGRDLDFVPRDPKPPALQTFGLLHATYSVMTLVNLILGVLVTLWIRRSEGR
jgi:hypothetical protein